MDVSNPVRSVVPSLDGPVLVVLAGSTDARSLADIHERVTGASKSGVRLSLLRLVEEGAVLKVPGGYILNREHLAAPAVVLLAGMRSELLRRIEVLVNEWTVEPLLVAAFGSFARRDGGTQSDIDLLLVTKAKNADEQAGALSERVRAWTGNACHVMALTPADLSRMRNNKERILREWDRDLEPIRGSANVLKGRP